jgi:hypothetical protein
MFKVKRPPFSFELNEQPNQTKAWLNYNTRRLSGKSMKT